MAHVTSQKSNRQQEQYSLTDFFPLQPPGREPDPAPNIDPIPPSLASSTNAPPTRGPGGFAGDELRAHRWCRHKVISLQDVCVVEWSRSPYIVVVES